MKIKRHCLFYIKFVLHTNLYTELDINLYTGAYTNMYTDLYKVLHTNLRTISEVLVLKYLLIIKGLDKKNQVSSFIFSVLMANKKGYIAKSLYSRTFFLTIGTYSTIGVHKSIFFLRNNNNLLNLESSF